VTSILLGLIINTICAVLHAYFLLPLGVDSVVVTLEQQSIILAVIGGLFYFARFRALDVFVKLSFACTRCCNTCVECFVCHVRSAGKDIAENGRNLTQLGLLGSPLYLVLSSF